MLVAPLAGLQATLDGDLLTLAQILAADLGQAVPDDHVVIPGALVASDRSDGPRLADDSGVVRQVERVLFFPRQSGRV